MTVNIFTDASLNHVTQNCGFAFYIGCRRGKIQKAGILKVKTIDITVAELHSIANAIYTLTRSKFSGLERVLVHSDSANCIKALSNEHRSFKSRELREVAEEIAFLCMEFCITHGKSIRDYRAVFQFIHVKAHTKKDDKHSIINNWCDKEAVKYRKIADKEILK